MKPERESLKATPAMRDAMAGRPTPSPPVRRKSHLTRDTRTGEVYWCDFNPTNLTPEFDDKHLVVIVKGGKIANDINIVVPLTKVAQSGNAHGYQLVHNPNPGSADVSWAVCNHLYAVASERLQPLRDSIGTRLTPQKLHEEDLRQVSQRVFKALSTFLTLGVAAPAPTAATAPIENGK